MGFMLKLDFEKWRCIIMYKKVLANCLEKVSLIAIDVLNEGICFFIYHQPEFPEKARKKREKELDHLEKDS